jgi:hypothetical protein
MKICQAFRAQITKYLLEEKVKHVFYAQYTFASKSYHFQDDFKKLFLWSQGEKH